MKQYYLKVGEMYLEDIYLGTDYISNEFIRELKFAMEPRWKMKIYEKDRELFSTKVSQVLKIDSKYINFEEILVEKEEDYED